MSRRSLGVGMFWFLFAAVLLLQGGCRENPLLPKIKELVDLYGKQVAKPVLDPPPGTYYLPLELETVVMSTDTEEADIYYTTDGSNPTPGSTTLFDAATPLSISRSCTVKAVAVKKYWDDSQVMIGEYTIPFSVEQRKLQAPDHAADDWFGDAVAASDQYLVVGAYRKDVSAIDQAGAAYIFEKTASGWDNGKKVTAGSNADAGDWFGDSVAVSGDYVVVGSTFDEGDSPAPANTGAVYVFYKDPVSGWDDGFKITATGGQLDDRFGFSVAISGDWLIVGALGNDDLLANSGAAYIYERTGTNSWTQRHMFKSGTPMAGAVYGLSVAISGDYAVVGAPQETVSGTSFAGAAYVYYYDSVSGTWGGEIKLTALTSVENARFGYSVAISGYYIVVGAYGYEYAVPAVEEAAYVFHRINTYTWEQAPKLTAPDGQLECDFALTVAINSEFAVVGARLGGEGAVSSGSAYVYHRTGANTWNQGYEILPSDGQGDDYFGYFVGLTEDVLITGAHHKDSGGTDTGSAYIFE